MSSNEIQLLVHGIESSVHVMTIQQNATIEELFEKLSEWNNIQRDHQRVLFAGKQLQAKKSGKTMRLTDYKIRDRSRLDVVIRLKGGMKRLDSDNEDIVITYDRDIITWDEDPEFPRAKMSCGHAIGPNSLTKYCRMELQKGCYEFKCPECKEPWHYEEIRLCAQLTEDECNKFEEKINQNLFLKTDVSECPKCSTKCEKSHETLGLKVLCTHCYNKGQHFYFCWACKRKWIGNGERICGNEDCDGLDRKTKILTEATRVKIVGIEKCPSIRACPDCHILIMHNKGCKQMECPCGQRFCFVCLKTAVNGEHSCSSFGICQVAPVQDLTNKLPGKTIGMKKFLSNLNRINNSRAPAEVLTNDSSCIIL